MSLEYTLKEEGVLYIDIEGGKSKMIEPVHYPEGEYSQYDHGDILLIYTYISDGPECLYEFDENSLCKYEDYEWPEGHSYTREECINAYYENRSRALLPREEAHYYYSFCTHMENEGINERETNRRIEIVDLDLDREGEIETECLNIGG